MSTFYEAKKYKDRIAKTLLKSSEVSAVGIGYAHPKRPSQGAAVIVYTKNKISPTMLPIESTSQVPIRMVQSGKMRANILAIKQASAYQQKLRPIPGGASIGNLEGTGTAGVIVTNYQRKQRFILSNNHVLTRNNTSNYSPIYQPGPGDGGSISKDRIGRMYTFVPLKKEGINYIDAALAIPIRNSLLDPRYLSGIGSGKIVLQGHVQSYRVGDVFKKVGRTTGLVQGIVDAINLDVQVDYGGELGTILFHNQTMIKGLGMPVSLPGDSGSVWLTKNGNLAAAVNFAGTDEGFSVSFPIHWAMQVLKIRIARPSGLGMTKGIPPKNNFAYVQPLNSTKLSRIRVVKVKKKNSSKA